MFKHEANAIRKDLEATLTAIDAQLAETHKVAQNLGILPQNLLDHKGAFVMSPLLVAKSTALHAMVTLDTLTVN